MSAFGPNSPRLLADIYRTHGPPVRRRAARLLGNDADAQEVVQEVFLALVREPEQFHGTSSIMTWLYSATTHMCLNRIRNAKTRERLLSSRAPVTEQPANAEHVMHLRQLIARLPLDVAQVAIHFFGDEMTQEEIASVMGCSRRHVANLLERLNAALRHEEEEETGP